MIALISRAAYLLRTEGLHGLYSGAIRHIRTVRRSVFCLEHYLIYRFDTNAREFPVPLPRIDGCELVILESAEDLERLARRGIRMPMLWWNLLGRGRTGFCVVVGREMVHAAWVATKPEGRRCCDSLMHEVDFAHGEAWSGGVYTVPKYRNRGLHAYVLGVRLRYLRDRGFTTVYSAVGTSNVLSQRATAHWMPERHSTGRFIRILKWSRWKEEPVTPFPLLHDPEETSEQDRATGDVGAEHRVLEQE